MKYLLRYNESISNTNLQDLLYNFSKNINITELKKILEPFKDRLIQLSSKYSKDGLIDVRLIERDVKKLSFSNEGISDNIVTRFLSRLIILPINIIVSLYNMFINCISNIRFNLQTVIIAVMVFLLSFSIYQAGEHYKNGISVGIVNSDIEFIPEHEETTTHYYTDDDGNRQSYTTTETIPDTWRMDVRDSNGAGRVETWETTDHDTGVNTNINDIVKQDSKWDWTFTKKYGKKTGGGGFSGGGVGQDY